MLSQGISPLVAVTVVIPVYNTEKYLDECLQSIQSQTLRDWEAICVDDGSRDNSLQILRSYANSDPRIRVIQCIEHRNPAYCRNRGMEKASGKYVYFLDSDDKLDPRALERLREVAETNELDAVFFNSEQIFETERLHQLYKNTFWHRRDHVYEGVMKGEHFFWISALQKDYSPSVWLQFWKREFLVEHGISFYEQIPYQEDELFTLQAILLAKRVRCINETYHVYRRRENSITAVENDPEEHFRVAFMIYCESLKFFSEQACCIYSDYKQIYHDVYETEYQILRNLYHSMPSRENVVFNDPMHELMYLRFCRDEADRQKLSYLVNSFVCKGNILCLCDLAWKAKLMSIYTENQLVIANIEPEKNHIDLSPVFREDKFGFFQIYFSEYYDTIRSVLIQSGQRENIDFMDGRNCFDM